MRNTTHKLSRLANSSTRTVPRPCSSFGPVIAFFPRHRGGSASDFEADPFISEREESSLWTNIYGANHQVREAIGDYHLQFVSWWFAMYAVAPHLL
jgi:hypothetical protein